MYRSCIHAFRSFVLVIKVYIFHFIYSCDLLLLHIYLFICCLIRVLCIYLFADCIH